MTRLLTKSAIDALTLSLAMGGLTGEVKICWLKWVGEGKKVEYARVGG